tara:strand:- start:306 stop:992 length:687 start_codon:yes stop_codon:yes gene_type:complete
MLKRMNSFINASKELHQQNKCYGKFSEYATKGSLKHELTIPKAITAAHQIQPINHILDHGCGQGGLVAVLTKDKGVEGETHGFDPAVKEFEYIQRDSYDLVTSIDVLEHVGREHVGQVLHEIKQLTKGFFFFCIDLMPANKQLPDGRNAHVLLGPPDWWTQQIKTYFKIIIAIEAGEMPDGSSYPMRLLGCATNSVKNIDSMSIFLKNIRIANKKWIWIPSKKCAELR